MITDKRLGRTERYRGATYTKPISAAKEAVSILELAQRLAKMHRAGDHWTAKCPLPNHEDKTPSFVVYPLSESFFCFGCLEGGDVVDLARLVWGYDERDAHVAAAELLMMFVHKVPQRPPSWHRKQERQQRIRETALDAKVEVMMRRLWRWIYEPMLADIEDEEERTRTSRELWAKVLPAARELVEKREKRSAA
jgi:hypothetical protein